MTPEHIDAALIDAVLPRVPAGIPALGGDLTDPDERAEAIDWLMSFYGAAEARTPSDTPAALRSDESGQHTLTAQTTIELPCSVCDGEAAIDACDNPQCWNGRFTFAVCVVDGALIHYRVHRKQFDAEIESHGPPAWLIEARDGTCQRCHGRQHCLGCIDGRNAVEVWQDKEVEDFDIWQVDNLTGRAVVVLGRGAVEHILDVVPQWHDILGPNPPVIDLENGVAILRVPDHWGDDIILDIDLGPDPTRKKVVLVRMGEA